MCESDSCILRFLNKLNLIYRRLINFEISFDFIPIVLVSWGRFSLCHTFIRPILSFRDQISILIVGCVTMWLRDLHQQVYEDQLKMKGESEIEKKDQPCEDVRKSEKKMSQGRRRLDSIKIWISGDSAERWEKKIREKKEGWEKKRIRKSKETC